MSDMDRIRLVARILARINGHWKHGRLSDVQRIKLYVYVIAEFAT